MVRDNCQRCDDIPSDILVLECNHKVCLGCASVLLALHHKVVECPVCHEQTFIDDQLYADLRLESDRINSNPHSHQYPSHKPVNTDYRAQLDKLACTRNAETSHPKLSSKCSTHPEYQLMYLCETCKLCLICPECVIHGQHHGHKVVSSKQFITLAHSELNREIAYLDSSRNSVQKISDIRNSQIHERISQIQKLRHLTIQKYEFLRKELNAQEQTLIRELDCLLHSYHRSQDAVREIVEMDCAMIAAKKQEIQILTDPLLKLSEHKHIHGQTSRNKRGLEIQFITNYLKYSKGEKINLQSVQQEQVSSQSTDMLNEEKLDALTDRVNGIGSTPQNCEQSLPNFKKKVKTSHDDYNLQLSRKHQSRVESKPSNSRKGSLKNSPLKDIINILNNSSNSQQLQNEENFFVF